MIKIYSTESCVYCKKAKQYMDEKGIQYQEIDLTNDEVGKEELFNRIQKKGVPVIEFDNGQILLGFNIQKFEEIRGMESK